MPQIYIESLKIENFGQFYGPHEFQFTPLDGKCGVLIGGKNGAGKTHLLRALYLAVVGESGVHDLKKVEPGSDATRFIFEKSLNRKAFDEGIRSSKLAITLLQKEKGAGSRRLKLFREIRHQLKSPPVWESYAEKSDGGQIDDPEQIQKLRDSFLPRHLARFFFFDAERSQSVNLGQQDIVEGISRILGLWTYRELEHDLRHLIQNKIPKVYSSSAAHDAANKLADLNGEIVRAEGHLNSRRKEHKSVSLDLSEAEAELLEVEDELRSLGAVDPLELNKSQERRVEITKAKAEMEGQLTSVWEHAMPVALLGSYRSELHEYLAREEKRRDWEGSKAAVEPKIPQVKQDVFEDVDESFQLREDAHAYYSQRLERALHRLFHPPPEGMAENLFVTTRNDISAQIRAKLTTIPVTLRGLAELCVSVEKLDSELRQTESRLKQLQMNSAALERGQELHERRGRLTSDRERLQKRLVELDSEIANLESQIAE